MSEWIGIGARFATYADLLGLFGVAAFGLHSLGPAAALINIRRWIVWGAGLGLLLSLAGLWISAAGMAGTGLGEVDVETLHAVLFETTMGTAWLVRVAALIVAMLVRRRWLMTITTAVALGSLAWSGHAASGEGAVGALQLGADVVHLLAAGAWIGALVAFLLLIGRRAATPIEIEVTGRTLRRFSGAGSLIVATLLATGLINAWMILGSTSAGAILGSLYGQLLAAKVGAFALMVAIAAANRFWLVPSMAGRLDRLKISIGCEALAGIIVLALVAWLGTLAPPG